MLLKIYWYDVVGMISRLRTKSQVEAEVDVEQSCGFEGLLEKVRFLLWDKKKKKKNQA